MICKHHLMQFIFDNGRNLAFKRTKHIDILKKARVFFTDDANLNAQMYGLISNCFHMVAYRTEYQMEIWFLTYDTSTKNPQALNEIEEACNQTPKGKQTLDNFKDHWDDLIEFMEANSLISG